MTTGTSPSSRSDAAGTSTLRQPVLLHQTVSSLANLSSTEREWQRSWEALGFQLQLADDERCRADIRTLSAVTANPEYLAVYDSLETGVQRSDMCAHTADPHRPTVTSPQGR